MSVKDPAELAEMTVQRVARDPYALLPRLQAWVAEQLPAGANPIVTIDHAVNSSGMSSTALLFSVTWRDGANDVTDALVARVSPTADEVPLFPHYAIEQQYESMRVVGELSDVPVPQVRWLEPTGKVFGSSFFCMHRVDGEVPQDLLPYNMGDNWLFDATAVQQASLQAASVEVLAKLHAIPDPVTHFNFLEFDTEGGTHLQRHLARTGQWYRFAQEGIGPIEIVDEALAWLEANLPDDDSAVLSWGDARIGNIIYQDFAPEAVIDWELAGLGPRELDLAWMISSHELFETMTRAYGMPGMPDFMQPEHVIARYTELTGHTPRDVDWHLIYAATIWTIVFMRTGYRQIHYGDIERPADPNEILHSRAMLVAALEKVRHH